MPIASPLRALAALLLLAACVGGPVDTPSPLLPATLRADTVVGANGTSLAISSWSPGRPRAVILAVHGYGDFGPSTFAPAARAWAREGIVTYAYDQRGFGRNPTHRRWPGADTLVDDLLAVARLIRARHPDLPLTVVGHSMGGGVALAAAGRGLEADRLVLGGPAIAGGPELGPARRLGGWLIAGLAPDRRFTGRGVVRIVPTDNLQIQRAVYAHPRHFGDPSGRELMGLIRVMDRAAAAAPRVTLPVLTLMGAHDQILAPSAVARVHDRIPGAAGYVLYPEGWHWLFRDRQAPRVWADVARFALSGAVPQTGTRPRDAG